MMGQGHGVVVTWLGFGPGGPEAAGALHTPRRAQAWALPEERRGVSWWEAVGQVAKFKKARAGSSWLRGSASPASARRCPGSMLRPPQPLPHCFLFLQRKFHPVVAPTEEKNVPDL